MSSKAARAIARRDVSLARLKCAYDLSLKATQDKSLLPVATAYQAELNSLFNEFGVNHNEVIASIDPDLFEEQDTFRAQADQYYFETKAIACSAKHTAPSEREEKTTTRSLRLPEIKVPSFTGNLKEWHTFFSMYNSLIHKSGELTSVEKFHYLLTLLSGEPLSIVKAIPISECNYDIAYLALKNRYQDDRRIAATHINELFNTPTLQKQSASDLRSLLITFHENLAALKAMGHPTDHWDLILFHLLLNKVDFKTRTSFENKVSDVSKPTYEQLFKNLEQQCRALESMQPLLPSVNSKLPTSNSKPHFGLKSKSVLMANTTHTECIVCNGLHPIYRCSKFGSKPVDERFELVKLHKLCINCLSSSHSIRECLSPRTCRICNRKHHSLLHKKQSSTEEPSASTSAHSPTITSCAFSAQPSSTTVLLSTVEVDIRDSNGNFQKARAILDSGSQCQFISVACLKRLGLKHYQSSMPIEGINDLVVTKTLGMTKCLIKPVNQSSPVFEFDSIILPKICSNQPKLQFNPSQWGHVKHLRLADPQCNIPGAIDLLIGAEILPYIFQTNRISGDKDEPVALETVFGYVLQGKVSPASNTTHGSALQSSIATDSCLSLHCSLNDALQRFWEVENIVTPIAPKPEDEKCEALFNASVQRDLTGRFCVDLPFKHKEPQIGDTYSQALRRLCQLERRLSSNPDLRESYSDFLKDYISSNHMSVVPIVEHHSPKAIYIPHHCVLRPDSLTTRLRVVFDASAKGSTGKSLNDELFVGPKLQKDIFYILLNFRKPKFVFTCDIRQMYRQILVSKPHRDYQRILWRSSTNEPIKEYQLNTVTFGVCSSPFLAQRTLIHLAELESNRFPQASAVLKNDIYVDDIATGGDDLHHVITVRDELISLLLSGGFELRKFASNHEEVLQDLPSIAQTPINFDNEEPNFVKVLGLQWNPTRDTFSYAFHPISASCTKRAILSGIARIYDPLGFLAPVTLYAKCILQKLWTLKTNWDDSPPQSIQDDWNQFKNELFVISTIQVPRHLSSPNAVRVELHGFCDASQVGYSAAVYVRSQCSSGLVTSRLCAAKSKVAPLRTVSLPRMELLGAVLLTDLIKGITDCSFYKFHSIDTWCDSEVVLYWLSSHPSRWKTFISNRTSHILETLPQSHWHYVPSCDNAADCASRGLFPSQLPSHPIWWEGPSWLVQSPDAWPIQPSMVTSPDTSLTEERVSSHIVADVTVNPLQALLDNFSSLPTIQRIVVYALRFGSRKYCNTRLSSLTPSQSELQDAFHALVFFVQLTCFENIIHSLRCGIQVAKPLRKLNLFLDSRELLRVGGRLRHSGLAFEVKHPLLLPGDHRLTQLLIEHVHRSNLHPGFKTLSYLLLQQVWILSSRKAIQRCLSKCHQCFKANPKVLTPPMGDLPSFRVNELRAFQSVCIDYAGPFMITMSKARGIKSTKAYVCVFVCCTVKAIHLELVSDLTSEAFLAAFQRFVGRRGPCYEIHSDQGTNLVGAFNLLHKLALEAGTTLNIKWYFNPPSAPHFNGLAEAGVKSVKTHLSRVMGEQVLTYEEFNTLLIKIEAVLNSRPLSPISSDANDLLPITPGHFLILEPLNSSVPDPDLTLLPPNRLSRWQLITQMHSHFWNRWKREYLHSLQQRSKWNQPISNIEIGTMVLVKNETKPPGHWDIARVQKVHPGPDGIIRVVTLLGKNGSFQRPVIKLCPLPNQ